MSTKARKRKKAASSPGTQSADLRRDVQEAIDRVWPAGIVELSFDSDESYFCEIYPKLSRAFHRIRNARLVCEREADEDRFGGTSLILRRTLPTRSSIRALTTCSSSAPRARPLPTKRKPRALKTPNS
jgi:hypothetical protein